MMYVLLIGPHHFIDCQNNTIPRDNEIHLVAKAFGAGIPLIQTMKTKSTRSFLTRYYNTHQYAVPILLNTRSSIISARHPAPFVPPPGGTVPQGSRPPAVLAGIIAGGGLGMAVGTAAGLIFALPTFGASLLLGPGVGAGVGAVAGYRTEKALETHPTLSPSANPSQMN